MNDSNFTKQRAQRLAEIEDKTHETNTEICAYGLSRTTNPDSLHSLFSQCGRISNICIFHQQSCADGGINEVIAKISFFDKASAAAAILDWNGREWSWREGKMRLDWWNKANDNVISSSGTSSSKQPTASSLTGKGVFLPKTGNWIPPISSQILAEINNEDEDNSKLKLDVLSQSMKEFAENLRARHDLHPAERVKVMKHWLEIKDRSNIGDYRKRLIDVKPNRAIIPKK